MYVKDFIKSLETSVSKMTLGDDGRATQAYIGFFLILPLIEMLGACFDGKDWGQEGLSETRFRKGVDELFPEEYEKYNSKGSRPDLYEDLRCAMVHQLRPGINIGLSERKHELISGSLGKNHLTVQEGKLILVYEDFLEHFKAACEKILGMIDNQSKSLGGKAFTENMSVPSDRN